MKGKHIMGLFCAAVTALGSVTANHFLAAQPAATAFMGQRGSCQLLR